MHHPAVHPLALLAAVSGCISTLHHLCSIVDHGKNEVLPGWKSIAGHAHCSMEDPV